MKNEPYASVDNLIQHGVGSSAQEICQNLIGKVDRIGNPDTSEGETWSDIPQVRITGARLDPNGFDDQFPEGYILVDAVEI